MSRMKLVEATLPPLEKAMLSETSHLQFVYTPGSEWHACIGDDQNHFIYSDLPHRIMDSYEECKEPPRLHLLDKFDPGGPGSCLTRYSDPTFFKKISTNSKTLNDVKSNNKKRRSCQLPNEYDASNLGSTDKVRSCSLPQLQQQSSGDWMGLNERVPCPSASVNGDKTKTKQLYSGSGDELINSLENHGSPTNLMIEKSGRDSSNFSWDGKIETAEPMILNYGMQELPSSHETSSEFGRREIEPRMWIIGNDEAQQVHETTSVKKNFEAGPFTDEYSRSTRNPEAPETKIQHDEQVKESRIGESVGVICTSSEGVDSRGLIFVTNQPDEIESETEDFVDAVNSIDSGCENDLDCQMKAVAKDDLEDESPSTSYNDSGESKIGSSSLASDFLDLGSLASYSSYYNGNTNFRQPTLDKEAHCVADVRASLDETVDHVSEKRSLLLSGFGHRSHIDGFLRTRSMEYNEKPKEVYREKIRDHENASSPPLDHMNISFQPTNSFETENPKLNRPKGIDHHHHSETLDDAFPSFQLVPEPNFQPRFNSDTDDDDISHHSGPNSELWGCTDSSESGDNIPSNAFCRASSRGSNSSSVEHEKTTSRSIHNGSIPFPDIPFDLGELTPALPPLPPLQWRVTKPAADIRMNAGTEPMNATVRNKLDEQKVKVVNVKNKTYQAGNQRGVDEREDFLHQIRMKSFNLRKTGLLNPPSPTPVAPAASGKVAAILEKAKTIRQVMTSDDGEDVDHWSDS